MYERAARVRRTGVRLPWDPDFRVRRNKKAVTQQGNGFDRETACGLFRF